MEGERHNFVELTKESGPKTFASAPMTVLTVDYKEAYAEEGIEESDIWSEWGELVDSEKRLTTLIRRLFRVKIKRGTAPVPQLKDDYSMDRTSQILELDGSELTVEVTDINRESYGVETERGLGLAGLVGWGDLGQEITRQIKKTAGVNIPEGQSVNALRVGFTEDSFDGGLEVDSSDRRRIEITLQSESGKDLLANIKEEHVLGVANAIRRAAQMALETIGTEMAIRKLRALQDEQPSIRNIDANESE